jgi:hypothetical protein
MQESSKYRPRPCCVLTLNTDTLDARYMPLAQLHPQRKYISPPSRIKHNLSPMFFPQVQAAMTRSGSHRDDSPLFEPLAENKFNRHPPHLERRLHTLYPAFLLGSRLPHTTCAPGCSGTSSWRHPRSVDGTGCARGSLTAPTSKRSRSSCRTSTLSMPGGVAGASAGSLGEGGAYSDYQDNRALVRSLTGLHIPLHPHSHSFCVLGVGARCI